MLRRLLPLTLLLAVPTVCYAIDQWVTRPVDDATFKTFLDFFSYDRQLPFEEKVLDTETRDGNLREHFTFQGTAGVTVPALYYRPPASNAGPHPAIIFLHGGGASGKMITGRVAPMFTSLGWDVLGIDLQNFGERKGLLTTFTEEEKHEKLYNQPPVYLAFVIQTVKELSRSIDFLVQKKGVDPKRIALVGFSRGAILSTIGGAVEKRFAAVVLIYGTHFDALETGHLPAACPANYIGRISPRPLLTMNGNQDRDHVKEKEVLPILKLAKQPVTSLWADTGHQFANEEHRGFMVQWLQKILK
jgi:poly(3-hydroxybutyrate) depolymerase